MIKQRINNMPYKSKEARSEWNRKYWIRKREGIDAEKPFIADRGCRKAKLFYRDMFIPWNVVKCRYCPFDKCINGTRHDKQCGDYVPQRRRTTEWPRRGDDIQYVNTMPLYCRDELTGRCLSDIELPFGEMVLD